jgi:hypothetical protein
MARGCDVGCGRVAVQDISAGLGGLGCLTGVTTAALEVGLVVGLNGWARYAEADLLPCDGNQRVRR